jgi:hypothetical protein
MPVERFMTLFLRGLYNGYEEMWISEQPYLFFTYANVFTPWFGRQVAKVMGPQRVKALKTGDNIFDIKVSCASLSSTSIPDSLTSEICHHRIAALPLREELRCQISEYRES